VINIRSAKEVQKIWQSSQIVKETLELIESNIKIGITTFELDRIAEDYIRSQGAVPSFKGLYGFPSTLCISINDEVVHGIPGKRKLKDGDIVGVDVGAYKNGYHGDHAKTFQVGNVSKETQRLLKVTEECLYKGIAQAIPGNRIGDISHAVQKHAELNGFTVVRELVGHGIGVDLHEEPQIPNYGKAGAGPLIKEGMCFAIEPMINAGTQKVYTKRDNWTVSTEDGKPSAHFEHTITVTNKETRILTK
jgi:methionyl aminopeptidase